LTYSKLLDQNNAPALFHHSAISSLSSIKVQNGSNLNEYKLLNKRVTIVKSYLDKLWDEDNITALKNLSSVENLNITGDKITGRLQEIETKYHDVMEAISMENVQEPASPLDETTKKGTESNEWGNSITEN